MVDRLFFVVLTTALLLPGSQAFAEFQPWPEPVFDYIQEEYGDQAEKRFRFLEKFILENQKIDVMEKVLKVNTTMNRLPWIADAAHWKQADYWATPLETITTFGGDCEDIALVKWVVLRNLGVAVDHLRLAYVKIKKTGQDHMVLLYIQNPEAPDGQKKIYVLDNYIDEVKLGKERTDLIAVLILGAGGQVVLINDDGKNRSVKAAYEERKIKKIDDLVQRVTESRKKFEEIAEGSKLLPEN